MRNFRISISGQITNQFEFASAARLQNLFRLSTPFLEQEFSILNEAQHLPQRAPARARCSTHVDPTSWSGMTIRESGLIGVLVNPTHSPERQASTMMHEVSHVVLNHVLVRVDVSSAGILLVSEYSESDEDEANWLSGALLLPRGALKHYREKGWSASKIAAHFDVSQEMSDWRIRMTGVDVQMRRARPII